MKGLPIQEELRLITPILCRNEVIERSSDLGRVTAYLEYLQYENIQLKGLPIQEELRHNDYSPVTPSRIEGSSDPGRITPLEDKSYRRLDVLRNHHIL